MVQQWNRAEAFRKHLSLWIKTLKFQEKDTQDALTILHAIVNSYEKWASLRHGLAVWHYNALASGSSNSSARSERLNPRFLKKRFQSFPYLISKTETGFTVLSFYCHRICIFILVKRSVTFLYRAKTIKSTFYQAKTIKSPFCQAKTIKSPFYQAKTIKSPFYQAKTIKTLFNQSKNDPVAFQPV